jgi:hypothetical protein
MLSKSKKKEEERILKIIKDNTPFEPGYPYDDDNELSVVYLIPVVDDSER